MRAPRIVTESRIAIIETITEDDAVVMFIANHETHCISVPIGKSTPDAIEIGGLHIHIELEWRGGSELADRSGFKFKTLTQVDQIPSVKEKAPFQGIGFYGITIQGQIVSKELVGSNPGIEMRGIEINP